MCGRYTLSELGEVLLRQFGLSELPDVKPSYNVAPGTPILAVGQRDGERRATLLKWGLVPSWAKDPRIGYKMINARSETAAEKPSFRSAWRKRRCLIPADGFFEWGQDGSEKRPYYIRLKSKKPFAFAGLWEAWRGGEETLFTCTILTTAANPLIEPLHPRMPVILPVEAYDDWLDPDAEGDFLQELMRPYDPDEMEFYEVSKRVNSVRNNDASLIEPAADE